MVSITLSVTDDIRKTMRKHDEINWSGFVRKCLLAKAQDLELKEQLLKGLEKEPTDWAVQLQRKARKNRTDELKKLGLI